MPSRPANALPVSRGRPWYVRCCLAAPVARLRHISASRRRFVKRGALTALAALASPELLLGRARMLLGDGAAGNARRVVEVSTRAIDLVLDAYVIDMLGLLTLDWSKLFRWQRDPAAFGARDFGLLGSTGIKVFHPAVETGRANARDAALRWLAGWNTLLRSAGCFLARVDTADALDESPGGRRLGIVLGFQDSDHFDGVADVEAFFGLGQRVSQLTYNGRNRLGSGCYVAPDRGLTQFGAEIVQAMNRAGMAIDVSHCGERTSLDAIEVSRAPVLITHANCRSLVPSQPRCKSDAVLAVLGRRGGVIGITIVRAFVGRTNPSLADLLDHFEHAAAVAGVEHVGLGSDVDAAALDPATGRIDPLYRLRGLEPETRVFQIADGLLRRGWIADDVRLVLGGNFRRALRSIWPRAPDDASGHWSTLRDPFCPVPSRSLPPFLRAVERSAR